MAAAKNVSLLKYAMCMGAGVGLGFTFRSFEPFNNSQPEEPVVAAVNKTASPKRSPTNFDSAIRLSREIVHRVKEETGVPGLSIAVAVDGRTVWTEGFGYADVENGVLCTPETVMRIASISKAITMTALAKLWEDGKVDLDKPVQEYVPSFPKKEFNGEPVVITTRMLTSHLSGIRHWKKKNKQNKDTDPSDAPILGSNNEKEEFYLNEHFKTVESALSIFKDDDLVHKPGTKYLYSSPAWTLVSAVMEKASGKSFDKIMRNLFVDLGLSFTKLDENELITYDRARYYIRKQGGRLVNAPCVDNSCKWAGGGFQSTVGDLTKFGNAMLYCLQQTDDNSRRGYLKKQTIEALWTVTPNTEPIFGGIGGYGMGWFVVPKQDSYGGVTGHSFTVGHTGGAVGASSVLLVRPCDSPSSHIPRGITVAIIVNLQGVGLTKLALTVSNYFALGNIPVNETGYLSTSSEV